MIKKLKLRLTLVVWITLLAVMVGVVAAINLTEWNSLKKQASGALETLCSQNGERPAMNQAQPNTADAPSDAPGSTPPPVDENGAAIGDTGEGSPADVPGQDPGSQSPGVQDPGAQDPGSQDPGAQDPGAQDPGAQDPGAQRGGQDPGIMRNAGQASASLSNYYTVKLNHDGSIDSWSSDRSDLYTDDEVSAFAEQAAAAGESFGHIGSCFYRIQDEPYGSLLIVLDMRLEMINAQTLMRNTVLIGIGSWLLLSLGAYLLIRRLVRPVQTAFDRQRQFVWDAGHELKTPLAVISANADALSRDIGENEWLGYIHSEIDRAARMINSMLTLAQIDQGVIRAQMKPFDLSSALTGVLLPFESVVFEAGKTLVTDIPDGISYTGDQAMIEQLTSILLSNAVKYANDGGTVTVRLKTAGRRCVLTVHNTGDGVSPRDREHLFERFYRAGGSHNSGVEGSGLGLAIAKSLTDAHKGRIAVDCPPEGGTLFTVTLP